MSALFDRSFVSAMSKFISVSFFKCLNCKSGQNFKSHSRKNARRPLITRVCLFAKALLINTRRTAIQESLSAWLCSFPHIKREIVQLAADINDCSSRSNWIVVAGTVHSFLCYSTILFPFPILVITGSLQEESTIYRRCIW